MRKQSGYEKSAHLYDLFDRKDNIDFFSHYAEESGEILDIGAGSGRIALPLARRGVEVYCVEPAPAMRAQLRRKLAEEPRLRERITLIAGDASCFDAGRTFPAAFLSGSFDHFLDDEERLAALRNINRHLVVGGVLVFDLFLSLMENASLTPAGVAKTAGGEIRRLVGGQVLPGRRKETILIFEVYESNELIERIEERSLVSITTREEVLGMLESTGFETRYEWSAYDRWPYRTGDDLLILEAVKKSTGK